MTSIEVDGLPMPGEYWKIGPMQKNGDQSPDNIYLNVGKALTIWESIECKYAKIFDLMIHSEYRSMGDMVYGTIVSPSGRRDALRAAAKIFFYFRKIPDESELVTELTFLINHHQHATARRNDIAHGQVITHYDKDGSETGYYLCPAAYNSNKKQNIYLIFKELQKSQSLELESQMLWNYCYTASDIEGWIVKFTKLLDTVSFYHDSLLFHIVSENIERLSAIPEAKP